MKKCPSFVEILRNDKSVILLISVISFYLALLICLPLRTTLQTLTIVTALLCFPVSIAYHRLKNFVIKPEKYKPIPFSYFFFINLAIFSIYFYATYPGSSQFDEMYQWNEVQSAHFTDWHPAIHTMIIWCLTRICNNFQFILIFQAFVFMILNSFLYHEISKIGLSEKISKWMFFLTVISPATCSLMMTIWKDISFAIAILGLTEILVLTYFSEGKWIKSNPRAILFGTILALASVLRHNGILLTLPFAIVFLYLFHSKYVLRALALAICLVTFIKFPLYSYLKVVPHPQTKAELCGLPMTVLSEIFVKNPLVLDKETTDFMLSIEDYETWKTKYINGSWNSIKHLRAPDKKDFSTHGNKEILKFSPEKVWIKAVKFGIVDPQNALNALIDLTGLGWKVSIFSDGFRKIYPITLQNISRYITTNLNQSNKCSEIYDGYFENNTRTKRPDHDSIFKAILQLIIIAYSIVFCIFWRPGMYLLLLILSAFFSFHRLRWKSFLIISPILIYNLGTIMLLCGHNDFRFFFCEVLITFPYMFMLLADKKFFLSGRKKSETKQKH